MGTITATTIINEVLATLQDASGTYWSRAELLTYLNDGQREICIAKPDAYTLNENLQLVAGTKQTLPAAGNIFMGITRNMGVNGSTPGRAPRFVRMEIMNRQNPNWHTASASATVMEYTLDERDPKHFYVSPPQPATSPGQVEIMYGATPPDVATEAGAITLDNIWKSALQRYMEFRAYSKDAEHAREDAAAGTAYKLFALLVGAKKKAEDEAQ